ncbi:MAG: hypothetical protein WCR54_03575 [Clostridia bacterium]
MKKHLLIVVLVFVCVVGLFSFSACGNKNSDEDIKPLPAQTIKISTADELAATIDKTGILYSDFTFSLQNDIDLSNFGNWTPIGTKDNPFMGTFLGNNHKISNFAYNGLNKDNLPKTDLAVIDSIAIFAYTQDTTIKDLTINDVDIKCYSNGNYFNVASLVGVNVGESEFSNITVDGQINVSNIYVYNTTYDMDGQVQYDKKVVCNTTQRIGGLVAYSAGNTIFDTINVDLDIKNDNYRAVYEKKVNTDDDGVETIVAEGYKTDLDNSTLSLPQQIMVGEVCGYVKGGATLSNFEVTGNIYANAKTVYAASVVASALNSNLSNINVNDITITANGSEKVSSAGIAAISDSSYIKEIKVTNCNIFADALGTSINSMTIGGLVAYVYNGANLTDSQITNFNFVTSVKQENKVHVGGIAGLIRESNAKNCTADADFTINTFGKIEARDYNNIMANIVSVVYGNSIVSDCKSTVNINLKNNSGVKTTEVFSKIYNIIENTNYVDDEGHKVVRLVPVDNIKNYIEVKAIPSDNQVEVTLYNNEAVVITTYSIAINNADYTIEGENCDKYLSAYFDEDKGILDADKNVLVFDGVTYSDYMKLTGIPVLSNNLVA